MEIPDCLELPLLFTNGPGSYYTRETGFIRDIWFIVVNCAEVWTPYKLDGEWYVNMRTSEVGDKSKRGLFRKSLHDLINDDRWEVRVSLKH